jgi:hypothetical protein
MPDTKTDIAKPSRTFPTNDDMLLWEAMSPAEQLAAIEHDEDAGFQSGIAPYETLDERLKRVRNL